MRRRSSFFSFMPSSALIASRIFARAPLLFRIRGFSVHDADLGAVLGIKILTPLLLRFNVLGVQAPSPLRLFGLELDDGYLLAIRRNETLVRDVAGHFLRQGAHA